MKKISCKADVSIARVKGLDAPTMLDFVSRLKASPKCRERRSILKECKLWFTVHGSRSTVKRDPMASQYSQQDSCYV